MGSASSIMSHCEKVQYNHLANAWPVFSYRIGPKASFDREGINLGSDPKCSLTSLSSVWRE